MKTILFFCILLSVFSAPAQDKFTITGYVKDSLSSETLIGASIAVNGLGKGINSNGYGFYSLTLPEGHYALTVSYVGYQAIRVEIDLHKNLNYNFLIRPDITSNEEVVVYAKKRDANVRNAQMGKIDLTMAQVKSLPVLFGEVDILKVIQLLPGVSNAGEGNTGLYVRGGGPD